MYLSVQSREVDLHLEFVLLDACCVRSVVVVRGPFVFTIGVLARASDTLHMRLTLLLVVLLRLLLCFFWEIGYHLFGFFCAVDSDAILAMNFRFSELFSLIN